MIFNTRSAALVGQHAMFSASKYHWIKYDEDKLDRVFYTLMAAQRGTEMHAFAHQAIRLGIRLPEIEKTINLYVNDAIGYRMTSEQLLYYSEHFYGTTDTISFRKMKLRIHDLKNGVTQASFHQHEVYGALFCLEYSFNPFEIDMEFRIYQNDATQVYIPDPDDIMHIMEKIKTFDKRIKQLKEEALS